MGWMMNYTSQAFNLGICKRALLSALQLSKQSQGASTTAKQGQEMLETEHVPLHKHDRKIQQKRFLFLEMITAAAHLRMGQGCS